MDTNQPGLTARELAALYGGRDLRTALALIYLPLFGPLAGYEPPRIRVPRPPYVR